VDLSVGGCGTQLALTAVVAGGNLGVFEEGEQVSAELAISLSQSAAIASGGHQRHHRVEVAFQPLSVLASRGFDQMPPPPGQHERPQKQRLLAAVRIRA
jgi:hypothetical protein